MPSSSNALADQRAAYAPIAPRPDELDDWDAERFIEAHGALHASFARVRHFAGVLLWGARRALDDGVYGDHVRAVAALYDVEPDTLYRWRNAAEKADGLPPADERSAGRRAALQPTPSLEESDVHPTPALPTPERVTPTEVITPGPPEPSSPARTPAPAGVRHEQPALPGAEAWGRVTAMSITELAARPLEELKTMQRKIAEAIRMSRQ